MTKDKLLSDLQRKTTFQLVLYSIITLGIYNTHYIQKQTKIICKYSNNTKRLKRLSVAVTCSTYCLVLLFFITLLTSIAHFYSVNSVISQIIITGLGNNPLKDTETFKTISTVTMSLIQLTIFVDGFFFVDWKTETKKYLSELFCLKDDFFNKYFLFLPSCFYFHHKIKQIHNLQHVETQSPQSQLKGEGQKANKTTYRVVLFVTVAITFISVIKFYQKTDYQDITLEELNGAWECTTPSDTEAFYIKGTGLTIYDTFNMSIKKDVDFELSPVDKPDKKVIINLKARERFTFSQSIVVLIDKEVTGHSTKRDDLGMVTPHFIELIERGYISGTGVQTVKKTGNNSIIIGENTVCQRAN